MSARRHRPPEHDSAASPASAAEERLAILLDTVGEGVILADQQRRILAVNRAVEEIWGYPASGLVGKNLQVLLSMEAREGLAAVWEDSRRGIAGQRLTLEAYRRDGSSFPVEIRLTQARVAGEVQVTVAVRDLSGLRAAQAKLRHLEKAMERMPVGVVISTLDGVVTYANPEALRMHGYGPDDVEGADLRRLTPEELWPDLVFARLSETGPWRREGASRTRDGRPLPVEVMPDVVTGLDGDPAGIVVIVQDIRERKAAEQALKESEERYALATRGANDGLWDWNLRSGEVYYSSRWTEMLGLGGHEVELTPAVWLERVHPDDRESLEAAIREHLDGRTLHLQHEHRMYHEDGSYRWMLTRGMAVWDGDGVPARLAGSQTDITDRKVNDPLTGLPNRALFLDRLEGALSRDAAAVLLLDLDRFKLVNDSLGHNLGDQLLIAFARRVQEGLEPGDTLARLGGDELALLRTGGDVEAARRVAEEVQASLAAAFVIDGHEIYATVSIGIAHGSGQRAAAELLRDAESAMYKAKSLGRARYQIFDRELRDEAVNRLKLETDLHRALERGELELYYQPIVSLSDDRVEGLEALLRWKHPELGLLLPAEFIPLAEENGLIVGIGAWVLRQACWQLRSWQRRFRSPALWVSVNLSAKQLDQPELVAQVRRTLADTGLEPATLKLEITESAVIDNQEAAFAALEALRALGVQISIDDFGTGYSSLSYLHRFPVDVLKIDRSFISALGLESKKDDLVRAIVAMARGLGVGVVAEGVETGAQLASLRDLACDQMQGFCFSQPLDQEAAAALLQQGRRLGRRGLGVLPGGEG